LKESQLKSLFKYGTSEEALSFFDDIEPIFYLANITNDLKLFDFEAIFLKDLIINLQRVISIKN
jgi:hypothetical protein